eukprot:jgi/Mesvir1/1573/Mv14544-RA.3
MWVTFGDGVYDVTAFVAGHPGGKDRIMLAAGGAVEPFWSMYRVHNTQATRDLLETYRIGTLPEGERGTPMPDLGSDMWANQPDRSALRVIPVTQQPFNAETPVEYLLASAVQANDVFFVRHHLPVPTVDVRAWRLDLSSDEGLLPGQDESGGPLSFSLDDLKTKFPKHTVRASIQCAGNRRAAMDTVKPVRGLKWGPGAVSTADWGGVRLCDVLAQYGITADNHRGLKHVQFEGLDRDMEHAYGASIPIETATNPAGDVLLAFEMNGEPLPIDHGFPLRVIVPGTVAARSVKWLHKIVVSKDESDSHWQQADYKGFCPSSDWDKLDFSKAPAIQEIPVQSAILSPKEGDAKPVRPGDMLPVAGYALSGGGREIIRVDVSVDGGETWREATLEETSQAPGRHWALRRWHANLTVPAIKSEKSGKDGQSGTVRRKLQLVCKAVDRSYNVQPERFEPIYNVRGVLSNAWHRVDIPVAETAHHPAAKK